MVYARATRPHHLLCIPLDIAQLQDTQQRRAVQRSNAFFVIQCFSESEVRDSFIILAGKLSPTSSHLFKLILPLYRLHHDSGDTQDEPPMVFLLHPSQPLSHIARLVLSSLPPDSKSITFRSITPKGRIFRWSESTDLGDFIRDAARATEFELRVHSDNGEKVLQIEVPTFADRTRFLRRRLESVERELRSLEALKDRCDLEAHRGARKMAMGGLGMLVVYWGSVARLTFWDVGWSVSHSSFHG